jgi:hypothetical protein
VLDERRDDDVPGGAIREATATCTAGKVLLGGGGGDRGEDFAVHYSGPPFEGSNAWSVRVRNVTPFEHGTLVKAFAICVDAPS